MTLLQKRAMCMAVQICLRQGVPVTTTDIRESMIRQGMPPQRAAAEAAELMADAQRIVEEERAA